MGKNSAATFKIAPQALSPQRFAEFGIFRNRALEGPLTFAGTQLFIKMKKTADFAENADVPDKIQSRYLHRSIRDICVIRGSLLRAAEQ